MRMCGVCDADVTYEVVGGMTVDVELDGWGDNEVYICSTCSEKIREQVWAELSNTVLIDGKAVEPGIYTCIWAGNQEWRVIQTKSDIIPDEDSDDMLAFMEVLALAIEGVLKQHEESKPMEL